MSPLGLGCFPPLMDRMSSDKWWVVGSRLLRRSRISFASSTPSLHCCDGEMCGGGGDQCMGGSDNARLHVSGLGVATCMVWFESPAGVHGCMFITDLAFRYLLRAVFIVVFFEIKDLVWGDPLEEEGSRSTYVRSLSMLGSSLPGMRHRGKTRQGRCLECAWKVQPAWQRLDPR